MLNPKSLLLALLATPLAAGSAWLSAAVAKYGVHLDPSGINALAGLGAGTAVGVVLKLIHEIEKKDPKLVAQTADVLKVIDKTDPQLKAGLAAAASQEAEKVAALVDPGLQTPPAAPPAAAAPPPPPAVA